MDRRRVSAGIALALVVSLTAGCGSGDGAGDGAAGTAFETEARIATNRLRVALQSELKAAMQDGGPVAAVEVCRTRAPEIAAEVGAATELEVGRVSARNRNPANAPNPIETAVLAAFDARPALADTLVHTGDGPVYMRAIRIDTPVCLNCHGPDDTLDPGLRSMLADHYPGDRATGFAVGDLRGAFVVR